jgi:hypothetical protein
VAKLLPPGRVHRWMKLCVKLGLEHRHWSVIAARGVAGTGYMRKSCNAGATAPRRPRGRGRASSCTGHHEAAFTM